MAPTTPLTGRSLLAGGKVCAPVTLSDDRIASPSWSPDDSFLVLHGRAEGNNGVVKLDLITGEKTLLAAEGGKLMLRFPHWRPDAQSMPDLLP